MALDMLHSSKGPYDSMCPSVHVSARPSSVHVSMCLCVRVPICLCVHLSVCPSSVHLSTSLCVRVSVCPFVHVSVCPRVCQSAHLSAYPCVRVSVCPCVRVSKHPFPCNDIPAELRPHPHVLSLQPALLLQLHVLLLLP